MGKEVGRSVSRCNFKYVGEQAKYKHRRIVNINEGIMLVLIVFSSKICICATKLYLSYVTVTFKRLIYEEP